MTEILRKDFCSGVLWGAFVALRSSFQVEASPQKKRQILSTEHEFIEGLKGSRFNKTVLTLPRFLLLLINQWLLFFSTHVLDKTGIFLIPSDSLHQWTQGEPACTFHACSCKFPVQRSKNRKEETGVYVRGKRSREKVPFSYRKSVEGKELHLHQSVCVCGVWLYSAPSIQTNKVRELLQFWAWLKRGRPAPNIEPRRHQNKAADHLQLISRGALSASFLTP